jgi:hypothetical protein
LIPARIAAVWSSEASSITITWRRETGTLRSRSTLSRIVSSSFSAGTRNTQVKASVRSGAEELVVVARRPRTKSRVVQRNIAEITTSATQKSPASGAGRPSKQA